ncbi:MAG: hypothetical protein GDA43_11730 [Hormoscilla sp. SP5CHS1]|nr:hypothetical protein [Hormoscilla sp. SP12CHS1]MBC6453791.1 hypothetical protein [Hormoscilla sp. SP5CHS1]
MAQTVNSRYYLVGSLWLGTTIERGRLQSLAGHDYQYSGSHSGGRSSGVRSLAEPGNE